uniref:C3H1-type domain-containing protein n=1 Tax=viral metagenome TaxID=1070528 RepID=A0A6C0CKR0_9ZZZZ
MSENTPTDTTVMPLSEVYRAETPAVDETPQVETVVETPDEIPVVEEPRKMAKEMCKFYLKGYCRNGDECTYAHGTSELTPQSRANFWKMWNMFHNNVLPYFQPQHPRRHNQPKQS